jgi:cytochrome c556
MSMSPKLIVAMLAVSLGAAAGHLAAAAPARPDARVAAVGHRQAQMKRMRESMKTIVGFAQGAHEDSGRLRQAAATLQEVARGIDRLFPRGTGVGVGTSKAKPQIWSEPLAFQRRIAGLRAAAADMAQAAATGDKARVAAQLRPVGAACKSCHDFFQVPH